MSILLAGVDLAWKSEKNTTAVAFGTLSGETLRVTKIHEAAPSLAGVQDILFSKPTLRGVAIDASLVIKNERGQRECERRLSSDYGSRKAACHSSNTTLYPNASSVRLSKKLGRAGFMHLAKRDTRFQLECYPHTAIIELFGLSERLLYKKGRFATRREGQARLAKLIREFACSFLDISIARDQNHYFSASRIRSLKGQALKQNEDALDAVVCLMVAAHYALGGPEKIYGDPESGYIYVPRPVAAQKAAALS